MNIRFQGIQTGDTMNIRDSRDTDRRYNEYKCFKGYRGNTRELTVIYSLYQ